jgi:hypothetical protein
MNGSAYFVAPKCSSSNTMCVLQTPLMNVELNGGKYHIKATTKYAVIYVLDGTVGIFDNQTNRKVVKQAGTMVFIFPSPMKPTDVMVTDKTIDAIEFRKMAGVVKEMDATKSSVLFALVDGKIIGIKM